MSESATFEGWEDEDGAIDGAWQALPDPDVDTTDICWICVNASPVWTMTIENDAGVGHMYVLCDDCLDTLLPALEQKGSDGE